MSPVVVCAVGVLHALFVCGVFRERFVEVPAVFGQILAHVSRYVVVYVSPFHGGEGLSAIAGITACAFYSPAFSVHHVIVVLVVIEAAFALAVTSTGTAA